MLAPGNVSELVLKSAFSEEQERAVGNVVGAPNMLAATSVRASNMLDDGSAAGVVSVLLMASFSGVFRGSLVLVFRGNHKAAQNVEVASPLWISWRRRDLGLSVKLRTMALVNETASMSPRQAWRRTGDVASALERLRAAGLRVCRWRLWHNDGELRASDMSWPKTAEVVLAPCTAKIADRDGVHERDAGGLDVAGVSGVSGVARGSEHPGYSVSGVGGGDVAVVGVGEHGERAGAAVECAEQVAAIKLTR
ncbi:Carbohydrate-binding protein [Phytophthora palmivora]|uniref:Carbohydrate-binding protein n=1 Tax=Phytophthora palmivora TaxID=4796 RepID=A0A2P4YVD6_9STRA|nr:Carbohydrate-binding protein [Phytophthora palmivora]